MSNMTLILLPHILSPIFAVLLGAWAASYLGMRSRKRALEDRRRALEDIRRLKSTKPWIKR